MGFLLAFIFLIGWIYHWRKAKKLRVQLAIRDKQIAHLLHSTGIPPLEEDIAVLKQPATPAIEATSVEAKFEVVEQPNQDRIAEMERTIRRLENQSSSRFTRWFKENSQPVFAEVDFLIEYEDFEGEITERRITPKEVARNAQMGYYYILAYCHLKQDERTFRNDNIRSARNLKTNREIKDLGAYLYKP